MIPGVEKSVMMELLSVLRLVMQGSIQDAGMIVDQLRRDILVKEGTSIALLFAQIMI